MLFDIHHFYNFKQFHNVSFKILYEIVLLVGFEENKLCLMHFYILLYILCFKLPVSLDFRILSRCLVNGLQVV